MSDVLIGLPLAQAIQYLTDRGIAYTVTTDETNPLAEEQIVVRISDAYHLVSMGMKLCPDEEDG